jgi:glycosyltransferase involved in cell wall biosynthesis
MMNAPKISIVTPSFDQGEFLEQTIVSVLDQNYPDLEYIVIDGGSNDNSVDIIRKYEKYLAYWVSEQDRGQSHAINKGFSKATGDIFGWLNSDDRLEAGALEMVAEFSTLYPDAGAFVGHGRKVDVSGNTTYYKKPDKLTFDRFCGWMDGGNFMQPSCFFRRSSWEAAGPLDEDIHIALDVDLWLRMARKIKFQPIDELLSSATDHKDAKTRAQRNRMVIDCALVVIRAGGEKFVRKELDGLADRLTKYEQACERFSRSFPIRYIKPMLRKRYGLFDW